MDTIYEESQSEINAKKKAKAIEVIEVEFENVIYADNDRVVRKYFQVIEYFFFMELKCTINFSFSKII